MILKKEFTFLSRDGKTQCHAISWVPTDLPVKGVFQIVHGMIEYIDRYDRFARSLAEAGYVVTGEDHLGHGRTAATPDDFGYFAASNSDDILVRDVHRLKKTVQSQYPGVPYFIMGHSMGSFITRKYISMYGNGIDGAIIMGTGFESPLSTGMGKFLCRVGKVFCGEHHRSKLISSIVFGMYRKPFKPLRTPSDWISTDEKEVDAYCADPFCSFSFTLNGFMTLFQILSYVCKTSTINMTRKDLPIFIVSGDQDPVGRFTKGPEKLYELYKKAGVQDVSRKYYKGMRHEPLNDSARDEVTKDILDWLSQR